MIEDKLGLVIKQPVTFRQQIHKRISELIFSGQIGPAERIVEAKLAESLGVSRTPVREALHMLEKEGILEAIPRVGYRVKEIRWEEVEEICEIRRVNETLAVRLAIDRISPAEVSAIEDFLNTCEAQFRAGNVGNRFVYDAEFHDMLARSSGSRILAEICNVLRRHMFLYRISSIYEPATSAMHTLEDHRAIFERIKAHDVVGAEAAVCEHLNFMKQNVREYAFKGDEAVLTR